MLGITSLLLLSTVNYGEPAFPLLDGDRQAVLVGAGHFLQSQVEQCTGVKLKMVSEKAFKAAENTYPIYVGDTKLAREVLADQIKDLDIEGYILHVEPHRAFIYSGRSLTDTGTPGTYSQADFARRYLGVDQYFPGELGRVYPKHARVLIPCGTHVEIPAFKHRHWSGYVGAAGPAWRVRASGGGGRYRYHHNLYKIIEPAKYADRPEFFPVIYDEHSDYKPRGVHADLKPGERYIPMARFSAYWQPCTTNPEVFQIVVDTIMENFKKAARGNRVFSLGINDSGGFCQCSSCLKVTPPGTDPRSDVANGYRFYQFYNQVAERVGAVYPDARLGFLVYSDLTDWYPEKLHLCLMPYLTMSFADCWDEAYKKRLYEHIDRWSKISTHFGIYEWLFGMGFMIPRVYLKEMALGLKKAHAAGAEGFYAEAYANWGLDGPKLWVIEKLLWNPDQDVDVLLDHWCEALFTEAAPQMRAYVDYIEAAWNEQKPSSPKRGGYRLMGSHNKKQQFTEIYTPARCEAAWTLLQTALNAANQDIVKKRIRYFMDAFGATRLASHKLNAALTLDAMLEVERSRKREGESPKDIYEWLVKFEAWARFPRLDDAMATLRQTAPFAFHEFGQESVLNRQKNAKKVTYPFSGWDTDTGVIRYIVNRIVHEAGAEASQHSDLKERLNDYLAALSERAEKEGVSVSHSVAVLTPLCFNAAFDSGTVGTSPVVDGDITENEWGTPQFDGYLTRYPHENVSAEHRTRIWFTIQEGKVFAAFYCHQAPSTIIDATPERDKFKLRDTKGGPLVDVGDGCRYFGYMRDVDSVCIFLPGYKMAIVTAAGGLFDGSMTPYGLSGKWNGATAKVRRTDDGWCAELAIDIDPRLLKKAAEAGKLSGVNFARIRGGIRSAWIPAAPRRWSVWPGTTGTVFLK